MRTHSETLNPPPYVIADEKARLRHDALHSQREDRFLLLGFSAKLRIFVVVHAYRQGETEIRIISARKATQNERKHYSKFL
ncbi:MAG: BrnT family toxin [Kiritimatiellia bacterium]